MQSAGCAHPSAQKDPEEVQWQSATWTDPCSNWTKRSRHAATLVYWFAMLQHLYTQLSRLVHAAAKDWSLWRLFIWRRVLPRVAAQQDLHACKLEQHVQSGSFYSLGVHLDSVHLSDTKIAVQGNQPSWTFWQQGRQKACWPVR